jgi:hypothetical protein
VTDDLVNLLRKKAWCGPTMEAAHTKTLEWKAADRIEQLERLLEQRDAFIVKNDLWHDFVAALGEKKDG